MLVRHMSKLTVQNDKGLAELVQGWKADSLLHLGENPVCLKSPCYHVALPFTTSQKAQMPATPSPQLCICLTNTD